MRHTGVGEVEVDVSTASQFFGDRVWTPADIDEAIGEDDDWRRYEIVDGVLIVTPHAGLLHQRVSTRLIAAVNAARPATMEAIGPMGVDLGRSYRVTDATVVRSALRGDPGVLEAADVVIAIEVESPSSTTTDRVTKPAQYAAAGIAHYWRIELDPLRLSVYHLSGDVYELSGFWEADETALIADPIELTLELSSLLR